MTLSVSNETTSSTSQDRLPSILDLSENDLSKLFAELGEPRFRIKQLWRALYHEGLQSFDEMTTLSKALRTKLAERFSVSPLTPAVSMRSEDGSTDKVLFRLHDGEMIETVLMRYEPDGHRRRRKTVCVSTQAGCALGCTFCATGQQGFVRQLSVGEIVGQVLHMQRVARAEDAAEIAAGERDKAETQGVTNLVFMGMGEPLANYDNTMAAIRVLNDPNGVGIGARHITVSTVGLVPQILKLANEDLQINLAVSLHAPDDETRSETMPINKRYPIATLVDACRKYVEKTNRRIFFEYVLLEGQNDTMEHAIRLGRLLEGLLCHVNLIPVNPTTGGPYRRPDPRRSSAFKEELAKMGVPSTVRMEKGIDINAGCGQLRARVLEEAASPQS
ncbi:MAG: 23S rRNA (adenine(2503)-C(2))-methyltransferase RlmN [Dehalococcoidia bacterium]